jgi:group I intron endonuclease
VLVPHYFLEALFFYLMPYAKQISAIYIITCTVNNKHYIGKSVHYFHRIGQHKIALKENRHHSYHLQKAYNKYGEDNFIFEILEEYPKNILNSMEKYWITLLDTCNRNYGYNILNPNGYGSHQADVVTKDKMRVNAVNRKLSEETKQKLREINLGKSLSPEVFENLLESGRKYRKTEKFKQDMISRKAKVAVPVILYDYKLHTWSKYDSITDAANFIGCSTSNLHDIINKSTKTLKFTYLAFSVDQFDSTIKYTKQKRVNGRKKYKTKLG